MARDSKELGVGRGRAEGHFAFGNPTRFHETLGRAIGIRSSDYLRWDPERKSVVSAAPRGRMRSDQDWMPGRAAHLARREQAALGRLRLFALRAAPDPNTPASPERVQQFEDLADVWDSARDEKGAALFTGRVAWEGIAEDWGVSRAVLIRLTSTAKSTSWTIYRRIADKLNVDEREQLDAAAIGTKLREYLVKVDRERRALSKAFDDLPTSPSTSAMVLDLRRKARSLGTPPGRTALAEIRVIAPLGLLARTGGSSKAIERQVVSDGLRRELRLLRGESAVWQPKKATPVARTQRA